VIDRPPALSWQRNLYVLTAVSFMMFTAFGFVFPFVPLFISQLGVGDLNRVELWSGITSFGQALMLSLFSPIWGALSDRHGRRVMLLRVTFSGAIIVGLMGLSQNIWQFLALRVVQGMLTGVIAAATAMASSFVPRERLGYALGLVQMSLLAGTAVGPLVGGIVADHLGYRWSFAVTALIMAAAGVLTLLVLREEFTPPPSDQASGGLGGLLKDIRTRGRDRQLLTMMAVLFSVHYGVNVVIPMLPLFVQTLGGEGSTATITGLIFTVAGVVGALSSLGLGRVGDRFGYRRLLIVTALGAGLFYIPQAFVTSALQLIFLRGLLGVFDGGLLPSANALIARQTEGRGQAGTHGTTYGLVYLATGMGFALGPLSGGVIAATVGLRSVFLITAFILLAVGIYLPFGVRDARPA